MAEAEEFVTRAVVFPLDVSPSEERLLMSYCGARRFAYNWVLTTVKENLEIRRAERDAGVPDVELTPAVSWQATTGRSPAAASARAGASGSRGSRSATSLCRR